MTIKLLRNEKIDIDVVENPEGLPYVDLIVRSEQGKIVGWHSMNKDQLEEVVRELQRKQAEL